MESPSKICITGSSGFLGSWLVKTLLDRGFVVHATLRNLRDASKVGLLKSLGGADERLRLFEADVYAPTDYDTAIRGCEFVVHLATPVLRDFDDQTQSEDISEVAVRAMKSIVESCKTSGTVKRLIFIASVVAASPLKHDSDGFKAAMDESCWTPLNASYPYATIGLQAYTHSKTLAEKELMKYIDEDNNNKEFEAVSLACGVIGGPTILPSMPGSGSLLVSQMVKNVDLYNALRSIEELNGKVPILHVQDFCEVIMMCIEKPSLSGRFLCASDYLSSAEIARHWKILHPQIDIPEGFLEDLGREIVWGSNKLKEIGFEYKYDAKVILDETLECAKPHFNLTN